MDQVMDGRMDRVECEEEEEQCDVCRKQAIAEECSQALPTLQEGLVLDDIFGDRGIGRSMSSRVQSSQVSEDGGFIEQSPIPGRHLQEEVQEEVQEMQDDIEAMFEK